MGVGRCDHHPLPTYTPPTRHRSLDGNKIKPEEVKFPRPTYPARDDGVAHPADLAGDGGVVLLWGLGWIDG